ncbi:MAG: molybdopterin-dependent oxidoreductase [Eggerthellaceae bacterium]|nr:molybdopterin-dependent oxidoreductase [Eggerthellaceae bacterium]
MNKLQKPLAVGASSILVVSSVAGMAMAGPAAAAPQDVVAGNEASQSVSDETAIVYVENVAGDFGYSQTAVNTNQEIKKRIGDAAKYLCNNAAVNEDVVDAQDWMLTIGGDVETSITASYEELYNSDEVQRVIMGCSCKGNHADGAASVNAEVYGIPFLSLLNMVQPAPEVNTVVFTSLDGYSIALPMKYVLNHGGLLVFDVNGAPIAQSVGGFNQLWMGSTAANYFARDIDTITFEVREEAPISPSSDEAREAYQNLPNVGFFYGGDVQ